jgi:hypothetical protein
LLDLWDTFVVEMLLAASIWLVAEANSRSTRSLLRVYLAVYLPGIFFYHPCKDGTSGEFADHPRIDGIPDEAEISGEVRNTCR